jgi:hypothetical protein
VALPCVSPEGGCIEVVSRADFYRAIGVPDPTPVETWELQALQSAVTDRFAELTERIETLERQVAWLASAYPNASVHGKSA